MQKRATGWIRPAMFVAYHAGPRLGDVCTLRWAEIDLDEGFISRVQRKTEKADTVYCPEAMPELRQWRDSLDEPGEYVFDLRAAGGRMDLPSRRGSFAP